MWKDGIRAIYARNRRLLQGCSVAGGTTMMLLSIGSILGSNPKMVDPLELVLLLLAISLLVAIIFGWWTARSTPRYAQSPLEYHQEQVERAIVKEWGGAIGWLRETTAAAEECSQDVMRLHLAHLEGDTEPTLRQTALLALHNRLCDLSRAVADLCQRGHAEAAFVVWRSIFEIEINMKFIAQDETDVLAERFLDWGRAVYLDLHSPDSEELESLRRKYPKPNQLGNEIGWTHQTKPMGVPRRAREVGYSTGNKGRSMSVLDVYIESNAYSHNDAIAITNDLGNNHPIRKGPSVSGHDMPLSLTARALTVATDTLVDSHGESEKAKLQNGARLVLARHTEVDLEVAMVPDRLISRFGGPDMTMEWQTEDGGTIVAIPYRRESTEEEMTQKLLSRDREDVPEGKKSDNL